MPVCLVLDDLHWADSQSVALLKHVVWAAESCALQVIVAFRDSDLGKEHPLHAVLADLRRVEGVDRIVLEGFGSDEVSEVMAAAAGHELDADALVLAQEIAARPTATRSSSARCFAAWWSPVGCSTTRRPGDGASIAPNRWACQRVCAT
jgi:hypothetical protein